MAKMTPEQEAAYALDFGVARSDLPKDALAYDRLAGQRARARAQEGCPGRTPRTAPSWSCRSGLPQWEARCSSLSWGSGSCWCRGRSRTISRAHHTRSRCGVIGVVLIAAGGIVVAGAFVRFVTEGIGIPWPTTVTSRQLIAGGVYRYVRNPMYLAVTAAIIGQALLLSRPALLIWAAGFLAICRHMPTGHRAPHVNGSRACGMREPGSPRQFWRS